MKQIGLKNFRKFENLKNLDFAPITILVGENNSGKSTVVKAVLSLSEFLNANHDIDDGSGNITPPLFYFNTNYFAHIGTFLRALNYNSNDKTITFKIGYNQCEITIEVTGDPKDKEATFGEVSRILMADYTNSIDIIFDFVDNKVKATFYAKKPKIYDKISKPAFLNIKFPESIEEETKKRILNKRKELQQQIIKYFTEIDKDYSIEVKLSDCFKNDDKQQSFFYPFADNLIEVLYSRFFTRLFNTINNNNNVDRSPWEDTQKFENLPLDFLGFIKNHISFIDYINNRRWVMAEKIEYIYAHAVTQTVFYSAKDTNDYLSRTIHDFANERIPKDNKNPIYKDISTWMKDFGVGKSFDIKPIGGEAHLVTIQGNDGKYINLADKGMGSIQLMVLFFRLGTLINRYSDKEGGKDTKNVTIIVEEPEQNLHPKLQSKLADLFYDLNKRYKFRFIIETHSEYLIRRSQVIVGEKYKNKSREEFYKGNPFRVYYFPQSGIPYDMEYTNKGGFNNQFGDGFFNEASRLNSSVIKNKLED